MGHNKRKQPFNMILSEFQETESSLKKVQLRMAEAEKRMIEDDIISDNMLMVDSAEFGGDDGRRLEGEFGFGGRVRGLF